jgi:hypothetical protein
MAGSSVRSGSGRHRWGVIAAGLSVFGLLGVFFFSIGVTRDIGAFWGVFASAVLFSCASAAAGGLLGFLFGVPRNRSVETLQEGPPAGVRPNTNLEQVSDWLTKILIGATLVQLGSIPSAAAKLFSSMAPSLGGQPNGTAFAGAIVIFFTIWGLLGAWLATRLYLGKAMDDADVTNYLRRAQVAENAGDIELAQELRARAQRMAWESDWGTDSSR